MTSETPPRPVTLANGDLSAMSKVEKLKARSAGLFFVSGREKHSFVSELEAMAQGRAETISNEAREISKHFGIYKQQERVAGRKSGDYIFMVRLKLPGGGDISPAQWARLDAASDDYGNGTLRLTTRQSIQIHYVRGAQLGSLIRELGRETADSAPLSTLGACGDVNRNTICSPIDDLDPEMPLRSRKLAFEIARELAPRSSAYDQIFLSTDGGGNLVPITSEEPLYGDQYLPRKFKVGFAHPRDNSIDVLTQDVGFVPVVTNGKAEFYDLHAGGGMGMTHNMPATKALLGLYLGRVPREQVVETTRAIAIIQKENGERRNRRQARFKYTLRRLGTATVKGWLRDRFAIRLQDASPQPIGPVRFFHGWHPQAGDGNPYFLGIPVPSGRIQDTPEIRLRTALRTLVKELNTPVRITCNQDLLLTCIPQEQRAYVESCLAEHGVSMDASHVQRQSFGCPAKPTCGLAMTDAEQAIPSYVEALEQAGLGEVDAVLRVAGCPNSCSRPSSAEIGIIGYGKNDHKILVGGSRQGTRLARILYERVPDEDMERVLVGLFRALRDHKGANQSAGDFLHETPDSELKKRIGYDG